MNYPEITIEPFPIMTWVPPALTAEQLGWYDDAGFNVMFIYPEEEAYQKMKKHWDGNWMVFKEWNTKGYNYKTMSDFHADDPKRIGFMLGDEPTTPEIEKYVEQYEYLRRRHPQDICIVNMFPSYVSETRLGSTFRQYVETYYEKLNPRYSSLDHYPCFRFNVDSPSFYHDLEIQRELSLKNNCKQFGFVQVYSSYKDRNVSGSDLAWQINSFLAYGCKGLWYFYFRHPVCGINELAQKEALSHKTEGLAINYNNGGMREEYYEPVFKFGSGVLDSNDQKGPRYDDAAAINKETLCWGKVLLELENIKVRHIRGFGESFVPVGTDEFAGNVGRFGAAEEYIAGVDARNNVLSMGYIVSYFEDKDNRPYVMIVNKRHGEYMSRDGGSLKTVVSFTDDVKNVYAVSNTTGREEQVSLNNSNACVEELGGGGAVLYRVETK
ncbi:hypothetical protein [Limihaloglobus sulfuriphilus]|nr:hypothetical protein [Limihaloglobus sulfuriphilus]